MDNIILSLILIAPLVGALLVLLLPDQGKLPAGVALTFSLVTFFLTLHLPAHYVPSATGFQFAAAIASKSEIGRLGSLKA